MHLQRFPLVLSVAYVLVAATILLWGQVGEFSQLETIAPQITFNSQLRYIDQNSVTTSQFENFRHYYAILSAVLLIFACLIWSSNSCLCRWLPHKKDKTKNEPKQAHQLSRKS